MAILWKQWQEAQARQRVRAEVAQAVYERDELKDGRHMERLRSWAELPCDNVEMIELRKLLDEEERSRHVIHLG